MDQLNHDNGDVATSRMSKPCSFLLSKDTAFEDLADRLDRLGERHHGKPVMIEVKLAAASTPNDADSSRDLASVVVSASPHTRTPNTNIGRPISVI